VDLDLGKVEKIRIAGPVRELVAVKSETGWKREGGPGDILGIDMNLWRLTDLKYESEPVKSLTESASHGLTLSMWDNQGELLAELSFYADPALPEGLCWMSKSEQRMFYPVSDRLFKDLQGQLPPAGEAANGGSSGNTSEKAE
jgi:hypothetical protein